MNKFKQLSIVSIVAGALLGGAAVAAEVEDILKARKSFMRVYSFNIGLVGAMAKGEAEYNAEIAANAAQNLLAMSKMKNGPMWAKGTSNADPGLAEKTRALPEIWTTYPEVADRGADLTKALEEFVQVAGKDLPSLQQGLGKVGKGCKGCHEKFRAEKEE